MPNTLPGRRLEVTGPEPKWLPALIFEVEHETGFEPATLTLAIGGRKRRFRRRGERLGDFVGTPESVRIGPARLERLVVGRAAG